MNSYLYILLLINTYVILFSVSVVAQTREELLKKIYSRTDVKVKEVGQDIFRIEYPDGSMRYKSIAEYKPLNEQKINYSPTYDSTIINITTLDTTLYYQKYQYWQEVPLGNFRTLLVGDVNNNGKPELYGQMKNYTTDYTDIKVFEMNQQGGFNFLFNYDTTVIAVAIYDVNKDYNKEIILMRNNPFTLPGKQKNFYRKENDSSLAKMLFIRFAPNDTLFQQNDNYFGDWDGDIYTDQIFITPTFFVNYFEYNPILQKFDSILVFDHRPIDLYFGGFSVGDFDNDGKTEFFAGSVNGKVLSIENCGNNCYAPNWQGVVQTNNAYLCTETNDLDGNGKKEIWIGGDAYYGGVGTTRITIFEANGNNSYQAVGKIDLVGIFSWDAGNIQVVDVDKDGKAEVLLGLDQTVLILKFTGRVNRQRYEVFYYKRNNWENNNFGYYGACLYNLINDEREELMINMWDDPPGLGTIRWFNWIYKPNYSVKVNKDETQILQDLTQSLLYPNPFNPLTTIKFSITKGAFIRIKVYNILGKEITTLAEKEFSAGSHEIHWEAKDSYGKLLPAGIYFVRLSSGNYAKTLKALLLK